MGPDSEQWIDIKGKKVNKLKSAVNANSTWIDTAASNNTFEALSALTQSTPDPHHKDVTAAAVLKAPRKQKLKPRQKHVRHVLRLLAQQESAFLDRSIIRAENERTEMAKKDASNRMRISADAGHKVSQPDLKWNQKARNAVHSMGSSINRAVKQATKPFTAKKTVSFASKRQVRVYHNQEIAAMITYDSGADGHYISERDRKLVGLPILRPSSKRVGVANGGVSTAKHVTTLPFANLSNKAKQADTFEDFPTSLMSVGKTADDGTISIFTKEGVSVHKEEDVLITCQGEPILIGIRDEHGRYRQCLKKVRVDSRS